MNEHVQTAGLRLRPPSAQQRNKVLRNTYWLLALSMVPTVLGAWVGVATGITRALSGGLGLIVFLAGAFGFMYAIEKTKNSAAGVPVLLGFTFFMGLMLSRLLAVVLGMRNGSSMVMTAFGGTAAIFLVMATPVQRHQARPVRHGQVAVRRRPGADGRRIVNVFVGSEHRHAGDLHRWRSASSASSCCTT